MAITLAGVDFFELRDRRPAPQPHQHDWHELVYIVSGRYAARTRQRHLAGEAGASFLYPAGSWHHPQGADPQTRILLVRWTGDDPVRRTLDAKDACGHLLPALFWLWDLMHARPATALPVLNGLLAAVLHERERGPAPPAGDPVARALRYLAGNFAYRLTLDELARISGLSAAQLNRRFQAEVGQPPMRYRLHRRIEHAVGLIQHTTMPLADIAARVGVSGPSHLSRLVRAVTGRPPQAWRGAVRRR